MRTWMATMLGLALLCVVSVLTSADFAEREMTACDVVTPSRVCLHSFAFSDVLNKRQIPLGQFRGRVLLVVNVATY